MQRISLASALFAILLAIPAVLHAQQPYGATAAGQKGHVTVTGCVVKGDGGYLLTNVADVRRSDSSTPPSGIAATGDVPLGQILYWLDDEEKLKGHEGHRVEVKGELEGDVKKGEMEIKQKGGDVEIEAKAGGKKLKAIIPQFSPALGTAGTTAERKTNLEYLLRRFDIDSVKMLASTCQ